MKRKLIRILGTALIFTLISSLNTFASVQAVNYAEGQREVKDNSNDFAQVNEEIKEMAKTIVNNTETYDDYNAASLQYAISDGDNFITSDNVGDSEINSQSMYGIGSVSKMYVTGAVMQLVDDKKIDLDLPVTNYIKDFRMADERYKKITPRMLINHSSGLNGSTFTNAILINDNDTINHDTFLKELEKQTLKADPGEFSVYCNDGFTLAEILVERVSGMSFTDYIDKNFSNVLGLKNTKTPLQDLVDCSFAKTYLLSEGGDPAVNFMAIGAGGIYSTAEEVCKYTRALTRKDGKGILSNYSVDRMGEKESLKGVWVNDGEDNVIDYGLGWDSVNLFPFNRYGIKAYAKDGDTYNYHACVIVLPDLDITMAVNSAGGSGLVNQSFACKALLKVLKKKNIIKDILPDVKWNYERSQYMPKDLKKYNGLYNVGERLININITDNGEVEYTNSITGEKLTLHHTYSPGYFMAYEGDFGIRFVEEKNGNIYLEEKQYGDFPGLCQIAITQYVGQKLKDDEKIEKNEAWDKLSKDKYFLLNEKYSSILYLENSVGIINDFAPYFHGYLKGNKIISDDEAVSTVKIPGTVGRDTLNYKFETGKDGKHYAHVNSYELEGYSSMDYINEDTKNITIGENGYTKYFRVPDSLDGASINVKSSDNTSFNVYTEEGDCLDDSYLTHNKNCILKKGNVLGFAGDKNEEFKIIIKK